MKYVGSQNTGSSSRLYYYKARVYHPELGRFMQTDPIGYEDGMNWYAYVGNDPINGKDPTRLCGKWKEASDGCGGVTFDGDTSDVEENHLKKAWNTVTEFTDSVMNEVVFGANAVYDGVSSDYQKGGLLGVAIGATGGHTDQTFFEQVNSNYASTSIVFGSVKDIGKKLVGLAVGSQFTKQYGGYSAVSLLFKGSAPHLNSFAASARLTAATTVINGALITTSYEAGNYGGSLLRATLNRTFRYFE